MFNTAVSSPEYSESMIPTPVLLEAYRSMLTIRKAEDAVAKDFRDNKIYSFLHLSTGQEAVAVGVCMALEKADRVFGNHRSHSHYLAKGGDLLSMLAEIYGSEGGCCHGKGGSMHVLDRSVGFMGSTPILGSVIPIATGSAFQQKVTGSKNITVVFFGDGASEEGAFYESVNIAAVKKLPVIYVVEDNLYAVNTPREVRRSEKYSLAKVVQGLGANFIGANGNSFASTLPAALMARKAAIEGIPVVMHTPVFRHNAHSGPICDESVRVIDTHEVRQQADPINEIVNQLHGRGVSSMSMENINTAVGSIVDAALFVAKIMPLPLPDKMLKGVYADN